MSDASTQERPPDPGGLLLAVPNVSEGRDGAVVKAIGDAFTADGVRLLDIHVDADHNRSVFTLAGPPQRLTSVLVAGAREAVAQIDMRAHEGVHPCVGVLDVAPLVHLTTKARGVACAQALVLGDELARALDLPVFLYGALAGGRTRADLRRGGLAGLTDRLAGRELAPDFGPRDPHPTAGVTLVAARPPLVAFNVELAPPADEHDARRIAALLREGGERGLPGVRAVGLWLRTRSAAQVSLNVEDPVPGALATALAAVRRHAEVTAAELVGLAPRQALEDFPEDVPIRGLDPSRHVLENALGL